MRYPWMFLSRCRRLADDLWGHDVYGKHILADGGGSGHRPLAKCPCHGVGISRDSFYGIALFAIARFLKEERQRKVYHYLTAFGLTPWLCLHLFYIMILYGFAWMSGNGYAAAALPVSEALFAHYSWLVIVSEVLMLPPYLYWFYILVRGKSIFPRKMALSNPLVFYILLKLATMLMPDGAFRLAFTNGLMSESMLIWFAIYGMVERTPFGKTLHSVIPEEGEQKIWKK